MSTGGKIITGVVVAFGAFFGISYYRIYETVSRLGIALDGITLESIKADHIRIGIKLLVNNPGNQSVYFEKTDLNFFINNRYISKLMNPAPSQVVYPGGASNLFFLADIFYEQAGGELFDVIKNGLDYRINIGISGSLSVNGLPIPVPKLNVYDLSAKDLFNLWK